jgi:TPR repeat protein
MGEKSNDNAVKWVVTGIAIVLAIIFVNVGAPWYFYVMLVIGLGRAWTNDGDKKKAAAPSAEPAPKSNTPPPLTAAHCYSEGLKAKEGKIYRDALHWFTLGAERGSAAAMNQIGLFHLNALAVERNYPLAVEWLQKAIANGDKKYAPGNINIAGTAYQSGTNVTKDAREAVRLYRIAAEAGLAVAQTNLASMYRYGEGVALDVQQARQWYERAVAQGWAKAKEALSEMDDEARRQSAGNGKVGRAAALERLDLTEGATPAQMRAAYFRLMQQIHPDKGGSNFFAKQLNEAREVLGF